jgi:hypothetical protein
VKTREEAEALGKKVEKRLGAGWKARVWENLGWHVAWDNGAVKLHYDASRRRFWTMVGDIGSVCGNTTLTPRDPKSFVNPVCAVRAACDYAIDRIEEYWKPIESSVAAIRSSIVGGRIVR